MRNGLFFLGLFFISSAWADDFKIVDVYHVSCLPEVKEFRAEAMTVVAKGKDDLASSGLYVLNKNDEALPKLEERNESCEIDGVVYKMKFLPQNDFYRDGRYYMSVVLSTDEEVLGRLSTFGEKFDDFYSAVGIRDGKIFVEGYQVVGADKKNNVYVRKEIDIVRGKVYVLDDLALDTGVEQDYNVVELQCFPSVLSPIGRIRFHFYPENISLPTNYFRFGEQAAFSCGQTDFRLGEDKKIYVTQNGVTQIIKPDVCHKKIIQLTFDDESSMGRVGIIYYDKGNRFWRGTYCYADTDCSDCNIYH